VICSPLQAVKPIQQLRIENIDKIVTKSFFIKPPKIKNAPTEVNAQKTQTPIVAELTLIKMGINSTSQLVEFAFLSNSKLKCRKEYTPTLKIYHFDYLVNSAPIL
jgi:hypothetical protein